MQVQPNGHAPVARPQPNLEISKRILNLSKHFNFPADYFVDNTDHFFRQPQARQLELLTASPLASKLVALLTKIGNQPTSANPNQELERKAYRRQPQKAEALATALIEAGAPLQISDAEASPDLDTIDKRLREDIAEQCERTKLNPDYLQALLVYSPYLVDHLRQHRGTNIPARLLETAPSHLQQTAIAMAEVADEANRRSMARFKISAKEISNQKAERLLLNAVTKKHLQQFDPLLKAGAKPTFKNPQGWTLATIAASEADSKTRQQMEAHGIVNHYPQLAARFAEAQLEPTQNFEQKKERFKALGMLLGFHHADS
ncbi:hypothetical protein [Vampirovibrio sp.]|uniref:hypothetical protein n=1 Tax=Vampirovibrio sp. TaxID=2717857 RepID=UPI0035933ED6